MAAEKEKAGMELKNITTNRITQNKRLILTSQ
jgi:hypothetical protein